MSELEKASLLAAAAPLPHQPARQDPGPAGRSGRVREYAGVVPRSVTVDRKATSTEVEAHAPAIREIAVRLGLRDPRLRADGTVVVHSLEPGYRVITQLSAAASELVGSYVHVITDDVPGAVNTKKL
jgi:hypothetical protein